MNALLASAAGMSLSIHPRDRLSEVELETLERIASDSVTPGLSLDIELVDSPPWTSEDAELFKDQAPAQITTHGGRVRISHDCLVAEIDETAQHAFLFRRESAGSFPLEIVIRVALSCRLPLSGGLLLHSAGVVIDERAFLFHGISGAGKSTFASHARVPLLSDELVALIPQDRGFCARATGFWGTLDPVDTVRQSFGVGGLFVLGKSEELRIEPLKPREGIRHLLMVAIVPPSQRLWSGALSVVSVMVHSVPQFVLSWKPDSENMEKVVEFCRSIPR